MALWSRLFGGGRDRKPLSPEEQAEEDRRQAEKLARRKKGAFNRSIEAGDEGEANALLDAAPGLLDLEFGEDRHSALSLAASYRRPAVVRKILTSGSQKPGHGGATALHWAAMADVDDIVEAIVRGGCDVDSRDLFGCTPLHIALLLGSHGTAERLLACGADPAAADAFGSTAVHYLLGGCHIARAMESSSETAEMAARWLAEAARILALLVTRGVDVVAPGKFRAAPIVDAASMGLTDLVELLRAAGAVTPSESELGNGIGSLGAKGLFRQVEARPESGELKVARQNQLVAQTTLMITQMRGMKTRKSVTAPATT